MKIPQLHHRISATYTRRMRTTLGTQMQPVMNCTAVCSCLLVVRWAARHVLVANPGTSSVGRPKTRLHTFEAVPRSWNAAAAI